MPSDSLNSIKGLWRSPLRQWGSPGTGITKTCFDNWDYICWRTVHDDDNDTMTMTMTMTLRMMMMMMMMMTTMMMLLVVVVQCWMLVLPMNFHDLHWVKTEAAAGCVRFGTLDLLSFSNVVGSSFSRLNSRWSFPSRNCSLGVPTASARLFIWTLTSSTFFSSIVISCRQVHETSQPECKDASPIPHDHICQSSNITLLLILVSVSSNQSSTVGTWMVNHQHRRHLLDLLTFLNQNLSLLRLHLAFHGPQFSRVGTVESIQHFLQNDMVPHNIPNRQGGKEIRQPVTG